MIGVDRYTKAVLTVIALALLALVGRPLRESQPAGALEPGCGSSTNPCYVRTNPVYGPLLIEIRGR